MLEMSKSIKDALYDAEIYESFKKTIAKGIFTVSVALALSSRTIEGTYITAVYSSTSTRTVLFLF
jgi:hypothetical protein